MSQQALNGVWHFRGQAAIPGGSGRRLMQAERAAHAEVIGVEQAVLHLDLLAFDTKVGDPVLAATVGAPSDVQLEVLVESGEALIQLLDQPSREGLGFRDGELAELGTAARDGAARRKEEPPTLSPMASSSFERGSALSVGTFTTSRFCMLVARSSPLAKRSARSAAACIWSASMRPRSATAPT